MDCSIRNWLENVDYTQLKGMIGKRQVYIWGAFINGKCIRENVEEHGITVSAYIDAHKQAQEYDGIPIVSPKSNITKENSFIIISVIGIRDEILEFLKKYEMTEVRDYIYISKLSPRVKISYCTGIFEDKNGNIIKLADDSMECKIELAGYGNRISIGRGFKCSHDSYILAENGAEIIIGDNVLLEDGVQIEAVEGGKIALGNSCLICKDSRLCSKGADMQFGNYVTMGRRFFCINGKTSPVEVGNDCMFANDVSIISAGGHSILNLNTKENVSMESERFIKIGNHVWLGKNATVLYNSNIGNGCIVGANSLVKTESPDNCILAGNPAKIVKKEHTWDRRQGICFDEI